MTTLDLTAIGAWHDLGFFRDTLPAIELALAADPRVILPPAHQILTALAQTQPDDVRVVILGQDPYPTQGHAHGLAFSADRNTRPLPRSLSNIFKEMQEDIGAVPPHPDLHFWARQGVLLLNTTLTVPEGHAGGHAKLGWQTLTAQALHRLSDRPRAYILWGAHAQKAARDVDATTNFKLETPHPSPLSARRGFFGSRPFSRTNDWLRAHGQTAINWATPETS